jgi:hypothetical protein
MITHNNFNYFITYILFSCIGHEEVLLQFQQTLAPSLGAHCSKTIYFPNQVPKGAFTFKSHDCLTYIKQHMREKSVHIKD